VIVDNGSTDATFVVAEQIAAEHGWVDVITVSGTTRPARGGQVVRAFCAGMAALGEAPDVVVKLDADVSFDPSHFERLVFAFASDPSLGMASGARCELSRGRWRRDAGTATTVEAQARAYRWGCLHDVLPLEDRMGWDVVDETKALLAGWHTSTIQDACFRHHRKMGARDRSRLSAWAAQGDVARYTGYRFSYLLLRALYRMGRDPAAAMIVYGYLDATFGRRPVHPDSAVRAYRRRQQRLRHVPRRVVEAFGRTGERVRAR